MSTKDFKEGMVAGAKPFGDKLDQLANVSESAVSDIKEGLDGVNEVVNIVLDDLSAQEKKKIFDLDQTTDISTLDDDEKEFLVAVLAELANAVQDVADLQRQYVLSVCSTVGLTTAQTALNLACIENIENMRTQKVILRHVMEFFFIGSKNYDFIDLYNDLVFCYFSVNKHGFDEIKTIIDRIYNSMGVEGIASRYTFANGYSEITFDSNAESELAEVDDYIPDMADFEELALVDLMHINDGETLTYKYKRINISSVINVDGTLQFENCVIELADDDIASYFNIKGKLKFINCEITGKIDNCKHSDDTKKTLPKGILNGTNTSEIGFENCVIRDAGHFVSTSGVLNIESCSIVNPGIRFLSVQINNSSKISNSTIEFSSSLHLTNEKSSDIVREILFVFKDDSTTEANVLQIENCQFATSQDDIVTGISIVSAAGAPCEIVNCEFYNFPKILCTAFVNSVKKSKFVNCAPIAVDCLMDSSLKNVRNIGQRANSLIDNCDFECCRIRLPENSTIKNCRFINSRGRIIDAESCKIVDCIFSNIRKWNKGTPATVVWGKSGDQNYAIYLQNCTVSSCVFDGVELKDNAFLIVCEKLSDKKAPLIIEKCLFRNCYTDRTDKQIIAAREYFGVFTSKVRAIDPLDACVGLDQVQSGELEADVPVVDSPNNSGIIAGAIIGAVITGGVGAVVGGIVAAAVDAAKNNN